MLGYVTVNRNALSQEEFRIYNGYYCGVCKSIGRRYGQFPRLALSYDIVFLALLLSSLGSGPVAIEEEHCIIHPITKKPVVEKDESLDYAGDMLLILAYHNFLDDKKDEHKVRGAAGAALLSKAYGRLKEKYPEICSQVEENIEALSQLEADRSGNLDLTCQAFGNVLKSIFAGYIGDGSNCSNVAGGSGGAVGTGGAAGTFDDIRRVLGELGSSLGKWIYIMDAADDFEEDKKSGAYNPLIYRERGREGLDVLAYNYLGQVSGAVDLLDIEKNKGIIENIIWNGLRTRTEVLLGEGPDKNIESDNQINRELSK